MIKIKDLSVGTLVSLFDGNDEVEFKFVSYDAESDMVVVRGEDCKIQTALASCVKPMPIGKLDGMPVYVGSVVYRQCVSGNDKLTVTGLLESESSMFFKLSPRGTEFADNHRGYLSWTPTFITQFFGYDENGVVSLTKSFEFAEKHVRIPGADCYYDGRCGKMTPGVFANEYA